jgi:hypothetical protein
MLRNLILASVAGLATVVSAAAPAFATTWKLLGSQTVGLNTDRDVFYVGSEGRFEALRFRVYDNKVAVGDVKVFYGNGTTERLNVQEHIWAGQMTKAYDLKGDHRLIKRVEVIYQTEGSPKFGRAKMEIYGLQSAVGGGWPTPSPTPGQVGGWEVIGLQSVGFIVDRDTIHVGSGKGRFRKIMLKVQDHDVYMYDLRVRFQNGEVQDVPVANLIRAGHSTGVLDLNGEHRTIERVDMVYRTRPGFYGQARVTLVGLH